MISIFNNLGYINTWILNKWVFLNYSFNVFKLYNSYNQAKNGLNIF